MEAPSLLVTCKETTEKFKNILKSNGITDEIAEVIVADAGLKTAGFASQTYYVTVHFTNVAIKPLPLFVKTETVSEAHSKFLEETRLFEKEAMFFMEYVPTLKEFCKSKGEATLLDIYPKCYFGDKKMIVLENLVVGRGFELLDREERQDFDAACLSLTTLAKHHALSHAFMEEMGGRQEFSLKYSVLTCDVFSTSAARGMMESSVEDAVTTSIQIIQEAEVEGKEEAISILRKNVGKMWDFVSKFMEVDKDDLIVLNHGDYLNNNGLFLRDKISGELIGHIAVDLQAVRLGSPATDLSNFLYTSVKHEVRQSSLKELLTVYWDVFSTTCAKLDHPVCMTYEEFFRQYCKKCGYGLWFIGLMTTISAGYVVLKQIDITKIDMNDWGKIYMGLIRNWIAANPEACKEDAKKLVAMIMEYKQLSLENE